MSKKLKALLAEEGVGKNAAGDIVDLTGVSDRDLFVAVGSAKPGTPVYRDGKQVGVATSAGVVARRGSDYTIWFIGPGETMRHTLTAEDLRVLNKL